MLNIIKSLWKRLFSGRDKRHSEYLQLQLSRSRAKEGTQSVSDNKRKAFFVQLLSSTAGLSDVQKALVIGCRNSHELDLLEACGVREVIGADLFSNDKRIRVMDMHALDFSDYQFDLIYCSHALEHALDYPNVLSEIKRVIKNNGVIAVEVPVNYETKGADIHDYKSSDNLIDLFGRVLEIKEIHHSDDLKQGHPNNFSGTDISRVIIRVRKR